MTHPVDRAIGTRGRRGDGRLAAVDDLGVRSER
jgi:hypothetical protein